MYNLALFDIDEIELGEKLGSGGFSDVHEILSFHPKDNSSLSVSKKRARALLAQYTTRQVAGESRLAIKFVKQSLLLGDARMGVAAARDLQNEAALLSSIHHPNILRIRGVSTTSRRGCFIIVDRLKQTLSDKILAWKRQLFLSARTASRSTTTRNLHKQIYLEQLRIALEIARALEYLHDEKGIVYRDLKPDNVGLDLNGTTKIFDLGLARHLPKRQMASSNHDACGGLDMSGRVGTLRYMAPEVCLCQPYDTKADVYSFGHLFWQMLALQQPYSSFSRLSHQNQVILGDCRPPLDASWPPVIQKLLQASWHPNMSRRPTMHEIRLQLEKQVDRVAGRITLKPQTTTTTTQIILEPMINKTRRRTSAPTIETISSPSCAKKMSSRAA